MNAQKKRGLTPHSLDSLLHDWNVLGIFYGFYLCKWEQKDSDKKHPVAGVDEILLAFIFLGMTFQGAQTHNIPQCWESELNYDDVELSNSNGAPKKP